MRCFIVVLMLVAGCGGKLANGEHCMMGSDCASGVCSLPPPCAENVSQCHGICESSADAGA